MSRLPRSTGGSPCPPGAGQRQGWHVSRRCALTTERAPKLVLDPRLAGTAMMPEDRCPDVRRDLPTTGIEFAPAA
jgi:hypothetical protein